MKSPFWWMGAAAKAVVVVVRGKPHEFLYIFADCRAGRRPQPQLVTKTDTPWIDAKLLYILPDKGSFFAGQFFISQELTRQLAAAARW